MALQRQVASSLRATITQKLLPALEGSGRFPVSESFILDSLARKTIMDGNFEKIEAVIEANVALQAGDQVALAGAVRGRRSVHRGGSLVR